MGSLYYPWADIASDAGLRVMVTDTNAGWEHRARSSGGFSAAPLGVMWHHAASSTNTSDEACVNYQVRGNPDNPVGNMTLGRNGDLWPVAGGASNCSGKGGPMTFSRGVCELNNGNCQLVNIECNNNGVGEPFSVQLVDAYFALSNALNAYLGNQPTDITSHALGAGDGYTDRKIDPATASAVQGNWRPQSVNGSGTWSLADMRAECLARAGQRPSPGPTPPTPPTPEDDDMAQREYIIGYAGADTNGAIYSTDMHTKTWVCNDLMQAGKNTAYALEGWDSTPRSIGDRNLFMGYGPVIGPRPEGVDDYGLPA
jgi:hypothetical protein